MAVLSRKKGVSLCPRDFEMLHSLWRWKLSTTATIAHAGFGAADADYAYRRLQRLEKHGLVQLISIDEVKGHAWTLGIKGYRIVRDRLPALRQDGFRSEVPYHDLLSVALQRGDTIHLSRTEVDHVTEQELRRLPQDSLPVWVPPSDLHRPDGYTKILLSGKETIFAFEMENTRKSESDYQSSIAHYATQEAIYRVIWVLPNLTEIQWFERLLQRIDSENSGIHLLVTRVDFMAMLWEAPVIRGIEQGKPLSFFLRRGLSLDRSLAGLVRDTYPVLNFQKRPYITSLYERRQRLCVSDRIADPAHFTSVSTLPVPHISSSEIFPCSLQIQTPERRP